MIFWAVVAGYVLAGFIAAAIAYEFFDVKESFAPIGIFWPVVISALLISGAVFGLFWLTHMPMRLLHDRYKRRIAAMAEVERLLK